MKIPQLRPNKIYLILILFVSKYDAGGRILFLFFTRILKIMMIKKMELYTDRHYGMHLGDGKLYRLYHP